MSEIVKCTAEENAALVPTSLDAFLVPTSENSAPPERSQQYPYVGFRGAKSNKNLEALNAADIKVNRNGSGTFYLMDPPTPIKIDPFKLHLIQYYRAYTVQDDSGKITDASLKNEDGLFDLGFREHIFGTVLVVIPSFPGFIPATLQLRGAQVNALKTTIQLLGTPSAPGFLSTQGDVLKSALAMRGPAWLPAAEVKIPGGRVVTTIWSEAEQPKNGGKQPFNQGYGTATPIDGKHAEALNLWLKAYDKHLLAVAEVNNKRFDRVRRLALAQAGEGEKTPIEDGVTE